MDRDQREYHQDVGSTWLVSCRNSPTPARDVAFVLHVAAAICCGSRWARRPATESATKSMRVIRLADGAVSKRAKIAKFKQNHHFSF